MNRQKIVLIAGVFIFIFAGSRGVAQGGALDVTPLDSKKGFTLSRLKEALYHSFGLDKTQSSGMTNEAAELLQKNKDARADTMNKAKELQIQMDERQKKMEQQIYGDDPQ